MKEPPVLKRGQRVLMRYDDIVTAGVVAIASSNGRAIAVEFDGIIAGCVGVLPVNWDAQAGTFRTFYNGYSIGIEAAP